MRRLSLYLLIPAALTACAGNDVLVQRQGSLEGRLEQIIQTQNVSKSELAGLSLQIKELKEQLARKAFAEQEMQGRYEALQNRVKILSNRLEQLETPARQSATIEIVNSEEETAGREEALQREYMQAFGLFSVDKYAAAAEAFKSFIANHPESEYAANARYWLGECYFNTDRYQEAIDVFTKVLELNPSARRAADAMLKIGFSWKRLDEPVKSATTLKAVIDKYPESEAAVQARQLLDRK